MNTKQWTPEFALEGIEERIKRISENYQKKVEWNHREGGIRNKRMKKEDFFKNEN